MRRICTAALLLAAVLTASGAAPVEIGAQEHQSRAACSARSARVGNDPVHWVGGPPDDQASLDRWCAAVGSPVYFPAPANIGGTAPPPLEELVVISWNAHLAEGRVHELVRALRSGELTGQPVQHFVLLLQELYRRGAEVPPFQGELRSAFAIRARDPVAPDARDHALALGLSMLYVPSMRNGADLLEDRGNAILSTEPITAAMALELPFERQRRVVVGGAIEVMNQGIPATLRLLDVHFEPLSSPKFLWVFRNPRTRQMESLLSFLDASRFEDDVTWAGTVLGGDFNTIQGGTEEPAYRQARSWGHSTAREDQRGTHYMGRLDYVFFRLAPGWMGSTTRIDEKFGSDHHPVLGRFTRVAAP